MEDEIDEACLLYIKDESLTDPWKWWSISASTHTLVADLAGVFLAIPSALRCESAVEQL
jgi:hypothetical protein